MPIKFKPMPWLTLITLICLGILIWLGNWQSDRLQWKTDLLVEIDQAANAAPLSQTSEFSELLERERPIDFRRVGLTGKFIEPDLNGGAPFHLMMSDGKTMLWHLVQPFQTEDGTVFVVTESFPDARKHNPPEGKKGEQSIAGYVRLVRETSMQPKSNPNSNEWYVFNDRPGVLDWEKSVDGEQIPSAYYIKLIENVDNAQDLPIKKPDLPNNHLSYMLTWYSFALILIVIYFLLHKKHGRLQFGNKNA